MEDKERRVANAEPAAAPCLQVAIEVVILGEMVVVVLAAPLPVLVALARVVNGE